MIGAGKAAASMARAVETHWDELLSGLVVTRYGHGVACKRIEVIEAAHPVPDAAGAEAAGRVLDLVGNLTKDDLVICLLSGGGSALLASPAPGIALADISAVTKALLRSGARIDEINAVRKHLSAIKGGRLAAHAHPARVLTLAISDVPGDDPAVIASGPTTADPSTFADARAVLSRYGIEPPIAVRQHLDAAADETPKPGDPRLARAETVIVARPRDALEAAASLARAKGIMPVILGDSLEGEARQSALFHAEACRQIQRDLRPGDAATLLLTGGELTVTVSGAGRGGPNAEFALALALALDGQRGVHAIACDTDGIDGTEDDAGALISPTTLARAAAKGLDPAAALAANDSYGFFSALGDLVVTGPTLTNVNDFRAILIAPKSRDPGV